MRFSDPWPSKQLWLVAYLSCESGFSLNSKPPGRLQFGFHKVQVRTRAVIETCDLLMPPMESHTRGIWLLLSGDITAILGETVPLGAAIHAVQHLLVAVLAVRLNCSRDLLHTTHYTIGSSTPKHLVVFEPTPGVLSQLAAVPADMTAVLQDALDRMEGCVCDDGCADCVLDPVCSERNANCSKPAARCLLQALLAAAGTGAHN